MSSRNPAYQSDVDSLIEHTSADQVLTHFGKNPPGRTSGELRMPCVFNESCADSSYGTLTINLSDVAKRIYCHSCGTRGNLLTLIHGFQEHRPPTGGRLRGDEFRQAVATLRAIHGESPSSPGNRPASPLPAIAATATEAKPSQPNVALKNSDNERARELTELHKLGTVDPAVMSPAAGRYFRQRLFLTPEMCDKWKVAYLPPNVGGTLRSRVVYGIESEMGDVLAWVGRDPDYDAKRQAWIKSDRKDVEPMKHRFPTQKLFRKGLELYGQQASRLREPGYREAIAHVGILIVEGMNDVIRLDALAQPAVGVMSNRITDEQLKKVVAWAKLLAGGKVTVMFDNDEHGTDGAKDTLWKLHQVDGITPRLAWSNEMFGGTFNGRQPESVTVDEWQEIRARMVDDSAA